MGFRCPALLELPSIYRPRKSGAARSASQPGDTVIDNYRARRGGSKWRRRIRYAYNDYRWRRRGPSRRPSCC